MSEVKEKVSPTHPTQPAVPPATSATDSKKKAPGLTFRRFFTKLGVNPYDEVEWETRTAAITDTQGNIIFEQKDVEVPKDWSMTATNIVASKYLHGPIGTPARETGARQLVSRVAETIRDWGMAQGYFRTPEDGATFHDELVHILIRQYAAFNSPVWFNVGCDRIEPNSDATNWHWNPSLGRVEFSVTGYKTPQCSACFINSVHDSLDSILTLAKTEGMLFKWGSGTGTNLSPLRSSTEQLSGGGTASGPLSFMKGFDAFAGVIKSGGKTRRAAKMVILNIDHPDIVDFIDCKAKEEAKAHALVAQGYDGSHPDSDAYSSIFFQNANNSVRVTDDFMYSAIRDTDFSTKSIRDGSVVTTYKAKDLLKQGLQQEGWTSTSQIPPIKLTYASGQANLDKEVAMMIQMWQKVLGVTVTADPVDYNTLLTQVTLATGNALGLQFWGLAWVADYPDPQDWLTRQFDRGVPNNNMNYGQNTSSNVAQQQNTQQQLEAADANTSQSARISTYQQAEQQLVNDVAWMPMEQVTATFLRKPTVIGMVDNAQGVIPPNDWANIYIGQYV